MRLPHWNSDWEKPDPLQGRRGWELHHYASVVAAAILLIVAVGVFLPAAAKARQKEREQYKIWEELRKVL